MKINNLKRKKRGMKEMTTITKFSLILRFINLKTKPDSELLVKRVEIEIAVHKPRFSLINLPQHKQKV